MTARTTVLHFTDAGDTSGFFPQLIRHHDRDRFRLLFGTLWPTTPALAAVLTDERVPYLSGRSARRASYPATLLRLARFLRRERVDVLHTHLFEPSVVGMLAGVLALTRTRVITRHYSDYHTRIDKHWHVRLDRLCTRLAHSVIAVSRHTAEHLVEREGAPAAKIRVVWNGIDFDRVRLSSPEATSRCRRALAPDGAAVILLPARLHPEKGHDYLFAALPDVARRLAQPVITLVAGTGPFEDAYRRTTRRLGIDAHVRFLGFRTDLPDLMAAADVVVLPSVAEAFGLVLVEALYLGTCVVATRVGGIPEIIDDGLDGILVPPADSAALATALVTVLADEPYRRRLAGAGRPKARDRYTFERMVREYEGVYDELSSSAGR